MPTFGWKLGTPPANTNNASVSSAPAPAPTSAAAAAPPPPPVQTQQQTATAQSAGSSSAPPPPGQAQQQTATGNSGPPVQGDHWQGGAANPNGTQDPQTGKQLGGRYVDPTYQTDANGRPLSPEEQAYWKEYDRQRAYNASVAASWAAVGKSNNSPATSGVDYDPRTQTWQYYDTKAKAWTGGKSLEDIYNNLFNDQQRAAHPLFYYQNQADTGNYEQLRHNTYNYQYQQGLALQSTPTTRYQPVAF